jgi:hypothetical protein
VLESVTDALIGWDGVVVPKPILPVESILTLSVITPEEFAVLSEILPGTMPEDTEESTSAIISEDLWNEVPSEPLNTNKPRELPLATAD